MTDIPSSFANNHLFANSKMYILLSLGFLFPMHFPWSHRSNHVIFREEMHFMSSLSNNPNSKERCIHSTTNRKVLKSQKHTTFFLSSSVCKIMSSFFSSQSSFLFHRHHHNRCFNLLRLSPSPSYHFNHPTPPPPSPPHRNRRLVVHALDSSQPIDYKSSGFSDPVAESTKLKIAFIGFGNFGQFLAKTLVRQGHNVLAYSRTDYTEVAMNQGVSFYKDVNDLCEQNPDVILLSTSIMSTEKVLRSLPLDKLNRNTLFVDVLSVKEFPRNLFLQLLPSDFDILCTHPMFGPDSGKNGWKGLAFVYDKVRVGKDESNILRCERFLDIFADEGCRMVEMSCAEHDKHAAESQLITHTVGRLLEKLRLAKTPINTKGYETLLDLVEKTSSDSFELYYGLFYYNKNSMKQIEKLDLAFESLKNDLFSSAKRLGISRAIRKLLKKVPQNGTASSSSTKVPQNGTGSSSSSKVPQNGTASPLPDPSRATMK